MQLESVEISGFKSFGKKTTITFNHPITAIVGPNGSGKSNVAEAIRFVLGEQSMKTLRGKQGTDLIFKGSSTLSPLGRASVTAFFNNKKNRHTTTGSEGALSFLQFDEIRITREIFADGANEYSINDTKVRLKDIQELLATANIGSSGHHMISQGEADRVLSASVRERREMLEDALGLKLYQYRIKETTRKLEKTESHLREGEIARREIAPHLQFLKRQVEKIEARKEQVIQLSDLYNVYLSRENLYLNNEKTRLDSFGTVEKLKSEKHDILENIVRLENFLSQSGLSDDLLRRQKLGLDEVSNKTNFKRELESKMIRIEAEERLLCKNLEKARRYESDMQEKKAKAFIEKDRAQSTQRDVEGFIEQIKWRLEKNEYAPLPNIVGNLKYTAENFFKELLGNSEQLEYIAFDSEEIEKEIKTLEAQKKTVGIDIEVAAVELDNAQKSLLLVQGNIDQAKERHHSEEKALYEYKARASEIDSVIARAEYEVGQYTSRNERFLEEIEEGKGIIGSSIIEYENYLDDGEMTLSQQELYRKIERLKIKLEDAQVMNAGDLTREYNDVEERDRFLLGEIQDLIKTKSDLVQLITELEEKLRVEFTHGIIKINKLFNVFFTDMFGGGSAELFEVEREKRTRGKKGDDSDDESLDTAAEIESGIDVRVALPGKKVRDLSMLSGGERALSSIALLFAISGVNPPPFMVLDETDAALDEANARRYGKSLKHLSAHSKLVVITHNRETMNQSNALYGVTVGKEGASKVLSVAFEEATEYAK
jgi:chromosome segregation protein